MEPLTETSLAAARERWEAHGSGAYRALVQVRPPRAPVEVWEVEVAGGALVRLARDGREVGRDDPVRGDYSVAGLFDLLETDLRWTTVEAVGDTPAVDLRAEFDPETGRLIRYRRTVGTTKRRVLVVEVLSYEPAPSLHASAAVGGASPRSAAVGDPAGTGTDERSSPGPTTATFRARRLGSPSGRRGP